MPGDHIIQENEYLRMRVVHEPDRVTIYSEYRVSNNWSVDHDAGISFERKHLAAVLSALKNESPEKGPDFT